MIQPKPDACSSKQIGLSEESIPICLFFMPKQKAAQLRTSSAESIRSSSALRQAIPLLVFFITRVYMLVVFH